jgi:hypothetical protein
MDFSPFVSLYKLYAPFRCLVGLGEKGSPDSHGSLPHQLTDLTMAFRFFDPTRAAAEHAEQNLQNMTGWLGSLHTRRGESKDMLHVTLEEFVARATWLGDIHLDRFEVLKTFLATLQNEGFARLEWATRPARLGE